MKRVLSRGTCDPRKQRDCEEGNTERTKARMREGGGEGKSGRKKKFLSL